MEELEYGVFIGDDGNGNNVAMYITGDNGNTMLAGYDEETDTRIICLSRVKRDWPEVVGPNGEIQPCEEHEKAVDNADRILLNFTTKDSLINFSNFINRTIDRWEEHEKAVKEGKN